MSYGTLPSRLLAAMDAHPNPRAQMVRGASGWKAISSREMLRNVAGLSAAFNELGVKPGDRVVVFAANRPEWHVADFAITGCGAATVPVYFHESGERMAYIVNHCGAKVAFVAGAEQLQALLAIRAQLPALEHIVAADSGDSALPSEALRYETLVGGAGDKDVAAYRLRAAQVLPGQLSSIIYTSGTTGEPKGVMLTHTNFCSNVTDSVAELALQPESDLAISFLPLAHVYGRMVDYVHLFSGVTIAYVPVVEQVSQALLELHPTVMAAVPRVFEKIYVRVMEQGSKNTGTKKKIFRLVHAAGGENGDVAGRRGKYQSAAEIEMGGCGPAGVFQDSRWDGRQVACGAFRRSATGEGADGIFLGDWRADLSGIRFDGNVTSVDDELSEKSRGKFRAADSRRGTAHRGRWGDFGQGPLRDAGLLPESGSNPRSAG